MCSFRIDVGEFAKDLLRALAHDVGQHIQAAAMSHRQHDFVGPLFAGSFDRHFQQRNQGFGTFERKALGAQESLLDEFLEDGRVRQVHQNPILLAAGLA